MVAGPAAMGGDSQGLRPFNPLRDLPPTAELIELAFGDALDSSSREMLREMRTLSWLLGPLFSLLNVTGTPLGGFYSGFVWIEGGRIVGNITVNHHYKGRTGWFISNLAVHPEFRRRGIATRLMRAGIDFARKKKARRISLEVRAENEPARVLYKGLGFADVDSVTKMRMDQPPTATPLAIGRAEVRLLKRGEWQGPFRLAQATLSPEAKEILPLRESDYRHSGLRQFISGLSDLLKGSYTFDFGAYRLGQMIGLLTLKTGAFALANSLSLMVHPDHRGEIEDGLLVQALYTLENRRWRPLLAELHPSYSLAVETFERRGFLEIETMDLLTLDLNDS
jgi:ribosomal protein S18 acetylase RimI-like enzyme